ncbi:hypothetical protein E2C01_077196 [Portunus trituberculatus]|uniref:Uncharacterized protein n=1 Tax=Portunus trituberculatus TaxID=210409 RepID=A0A5B7IQQ3_PORTR|nr:hypothetical protein [Portunus trituberculatus]
MVIGEATSFQGRRNTGRKRIEVFCSRCVTLPREPIRECRGPRAGHHKGVIGVGRFQGRGTEREEGEGEAEGVRKWVWQ